MGNREKYMFMMRIIMRSVMLSIKFKMLWKKVTKFKLILNFID